MVRVTVLRYPDSLSARDARITQYMDFILECHDYQPWIEGGSFVASVQHYSLWLDVPRTGSQLGLQIGCL